MLTGWKDPFGHNLLGLWLADRHDRRHGETARMAARRGLIKPLGERGKVIWILAGNTRASVHQAVELTAAIRAKRLDIRLILTFEQDFPDLLAPLDNCDKTGWGYAPSDHPRALKRALQRLDPYGFIVVDTHVRRHLSAILDKSPRVLATHPGKTNFRHETIGSGADWQTLFTQAQVDPNFKSLVNQNSERHLWWWHGPFDPQARQDWQAHLPEDVLFVSGAMPAGQHLTISQWNREPLANGDVVWVDDEKWLPAIAASVTGSHFASHDSALLWQAMAGGHAASSSSILLPDNLKTAITTAALPFEHWQNWRAQPFVTRKIGDTARRLFWQTRRQAEQDSQQIIERVFEW